MQTVIDEAEFIGRAREFLQSRIGPSADELSAETDLVRSGVLDSLLVLEFFFFLEELRGSPVPPTMVSTEALSTLRAAYQLVTAA